MIVIAPGLLYTHNTNVHEIVFQDVQTATVAAFAERLKTIITELPEDELMRLLIHVPAVPSIQYMLGAIREIREAHPKVRPARIAIIYIPSMQFSVLNMVVRALVRSSTLKLFHQQDEAEARKWLSR
jgi:hypothetical protein